MTTPRPAPGWYPDPSGTPGQRYFDGVNWTDQRSAPQAPPPKSAAAAGLLQLFFGWFGLGRFYIGSIGIACTQLILGLIGLATVWLFGLGLIILIPLSLWVFIDAIMMFAGAVRDSDGHQLR